MIFISYLICYSSAYLPIDSQSNGGYLNVGPPNLGFELVSMFPVQ